MMHAQALTNLVRKPVRDSYGRYVGYVLGFSLDNTGHIKGIGVELAGGDFAEYPNERIIVDSESIILLPEWKEEVERLKRDIALAQRRSAVLEELSKEGEVPVHVYDDLKEKYKHEIESLTTTLDCLTDAFKTKVATLDEKRVVIDKFLGGLKVQCRTGEIDNQAYKTASDTIDAVLQRDGAERAEVLSMLSWLTDISNDTSKSGIPIAATIQN